MFRSTPGDRSSRAYQIRLPGREKPLLITRPLISKSSLPKPNDRRFSTSKQRQNSVKYRNAASPRTTAILSAAVLLGRRSALSFVIAMNLSEDVDARNPAPLRLRYQQRHISSLRLCSGEPPSKSTVAVIRREHTQGIMNSPQTIGIPRIRADLITHSWQIRQGPLPGAPPKLDGVIFSFQNSPQTFTSTATGPWGQGQWHIVERGSHADLRIMPKLQIPGLFLEWSKISEVWRPAYGYGENFILVRLNKTKRPF